MKPKDEYELALEYGHYVKRDAYQKLLRWKKEDAREHKALFLRGARRVGKSCLAHEFAHREYRSFITVSFNSVSDTVKELFVNSLMNLDGFYDELSIAYDTKLYEGESLIILDEIQLYKPARQAIKTLIQDGRYDILETGSLASVTKRSKEEGDYLLPSEECKIDVDPLSFKEFLTAMGKEDLISFIQSRVDDRKPFGAAYRQINRLFREYLFVGGMPKCVSTYLKTLDLVRVQREKRSILDLYYDDFNRQENVNKIYLSSIFDLIPSELSNHDKRFKLTHLNENARVREYGPAFMWLKDAYLTNLCLNSTDPSVLAKLTASGEDVKAYFIDTGLLYSLSMAKGEEDELFLKSLLLDKLHVNEGMFLENYIAQVLKAKGNSDLFFYEKRDQKTYKTLMEIDFLAIRNRKILPIEAKSSDSSSLRSLKKFKETFGTRVSDGVVFHDGETEVKDGIPFFPAFAIEWYL